MTQYPNPTEVFIANFPIFTVYADNLRTDIQRLTQGLPPYADFSHQVMAVWFNLKGDLELSNINNNLIFRFSDVFKDNQQSYYFAGSSNMEKTLSDLREHLPNLEVLSCVPYESAVEMAKEPGTTITEDRDSFEYILSVDEQISLPGTRFGKYRRKVNKTASEFSSRISTGLIDLGSHHNSTLLLKLSEGWGARNDPEQIELDAITRSIIKAKDLELSAIAVSIDGNIEAFTLFFIATDGKTANISHTKANPKYHNLFDYTVHTSASALKELGVTAINFEMDLGIAGLRMHKMGLRPTNFLKKYSVKF